MKALTHVAQPIELAIELNFRNPDLFLNALAAESGLNKPEPKSFFLEIVAPLIHNNEAQKALNTLNLQLGVTALGLIDFNHKPEPKTYSLIAAHVNNYDVASFALTAAAKGGDIKTTFSKVLQVNTYSIQKTHVALYKGMALVGDSLNALEIGGKYAAFRAYKTSSFSRDITLRIPFATAGKVAQEYLNSEWSKIKVGANFFAEAIPASLKLTLEPMVEPLLSTLTDSEDAVLEADLLGQNLVYDGHIQTKGSFAKWVSSHPTGDASALLSMPKGEDVGVWRWGHMAQHLGPLLSSLVGELLPMWIPAPSRAELLKQIPIFANSIDAEIAYVTSKNKAPLDVSTFDPETFVKISLRDVNTVKSLLPKLTQEAEVALQSRIKITRTKLKEFGAEGETITLAPTGSLTDESKLIWAIRDSYLFVDVCFLCTPMLFKSGVDPASKDTWAFHENAVSQVNSFPKTNLISASYMPAHDVVDLLSSARAFVDAGIHVNSLGDSEISTDALPIKRTTLSATWSWVTVSPNGLLALKGSASTSTLNFIVQMLWSLPLAYHSGRAEATAPSPSTP